MFWSQNVLYFIAICQMPHRSLLRWAGPGELGVMDPLLIQAPLNLALQHGQQGQPRVKESLKSR